MKSLNLFTILKAKILGFIWSEALYGASPGFLFSIAALFLSRMHTGANMTQALKNSQEVLYIFVPSFFFIGVLFSSLSEEHVVYSTQILCVAF